MAQGSRPQSDSSGTLLQRPRPEQWDSTVTLCCCLSVPEQKRGNKGASWGSHLAPLTGVKSAECLMEVQRSCLGSRRWH